MPSHLDHYGAPVLSVPDRDDIYSPLQNALNFSPRRGASRFEFWESNIAGRLGLGQALGEVLGQGQETIARIILERANYLFDALQGFDSVMLHHTPECGIVTFWVPGVSSSLIGQHLQTPLEGIAFEVSVVPATSTPVDTAATGVPDLLRASVSYTTSTRDLDLFCSRLKQILSEEAAIADIDYDL